MARIKARNLGLFDNLYGKSLVVLISILGTLDCLEDVTEGANADLFKERVLVYFLESLSSAARHTFSLFYFAAHRRLVNFDFFFYCVLQVKVNLRLTKATVRDKALFCIFFKRGARS